MLLTWDNPGERLYETGVSNGVLYIPDNAGLYNNGVAWNGLTALTESPSGAESNKQYADNIVYVNLTSAEEFSGTLEAFTSPREFDQFDGLATPVPGFNIGQQRRRTFGLSYKTLVGNDIDGSDHGYKLHVIYGASAAPSERSYATVNDSPEGMTLSWEITTTPVPVGVGYRPTATLTFDSTLIPAAKMTEIENLLWGTEGVDPQLPTPAEFITLLGGTTVQVEPTAPTYNATTKVITIPSTAGVEYFIDGVKKNAGALPAITKDTLVIAKPASGYKFPVPTDDDWLFKFA